MIFYKNDNEKKCDPDLFVLRLSWFNNEIKFLLKRFCGKIIQYSTI